MVFVVCVRENLASWCVALYFNLFPSLLVFRTFWPLFSVSSAFMNSSRSSSYLSVLQCFCSSFFCGDDAWVPLCCFFRPSGFFTVLKLFSWPIATSTSVVSRSNFSVFFTVCMFFRLSCAPFDKIDPVLFFVIGSARVVVRVVFLPLRSTVVLRTEYLARPFWENVASSNVCEQWEQKCQKAVVISNASDVHVTSSNTPSSSLH